MNGTPAKIQKLIDEGYEFNFGDYINRGFALFQKEIGMFILGLILLMLLSAVASFIPILGGLISAIVVTPVLIVGFYHAGNKTELGEKVEVGDFFKGFDKIGDLILTGLLVFIVTVGAMLPGLILAVSSGVWSLFTFGDLSDVNTNMLILGIALAVVPAVYFSVSYTWSYALVWFYGMKPWPALEASRKLIGKKWFVVFLFLLVAGLIAGLGILVLLVGVLFTAPAMYLAQYAAFADVTSLMDESEDESSADIIDHFAPTA